jgi:hypothetical protein
MLMADDSRLPALQFINQRPHQPPPYPHPNGRRHRPPAAAQQSTSLLNHSLHTSCTHLRSRGVSVGDPQAGSVQRTDGSTGVRQGAVLQDGPRWAPFFINFGLPIDDWFVRFREQGFPKDPWALQAVRVEVLDHLTSASWLADVFGLDVVHIGQDTAQVSLPGCAITFAPGPGDRITAVALTGPGAPKGSVAGLRYLDTGSATSPLPG